MSDLTEVVFEGIPDRKLKDLLDSIVAMGEIESIEYGDHCEEKSLAELKTLLPADGFAFVRVRSLALNKNVLLDLVLIRIFRGENRVNLLDFTFGTNDIESDFTSNIKELHRLTTSLARRFEVECYYAGMEPADDLNTRYFTNEEYGALFSKTA